MSSIACEDISIDYFDPDTFHCEKCGRDIPIEMVLYDGYLYKCPACEVWQEGD